VNVQNPDADVAATNLARRDELSVRYVHLLSDEAVPALAAGLADAATPADVRARLRADLAGRLERLEQAPHGAVATWRNWTAFHVARWRARDVLLALRRDGAI
jgi:hypothetical protein